MNTKDIIKLYNRIIARKLPPINPDKYKGSKKAILDKITAEVGDIPLDQLRATYYPDHAAALHDIENKMPKMQLPQKKFIDTSVDVAAINKFLEEHPQVKAAPKAAPKAKVERSQEGTSSAVEAANILGIPATKLRAKLRKLGMKAPYPSAQEIIERVK